MLNLALRYKYDHKILKTNIYVVYVIYVIMIKGIVYKRSPYRDGFQVSDIFVLRIMANDHDYGYRTRSPCHS